MHQHLRRLFDQYSDAAQRGVKKRQSPATDQSGSGQRRQQQQTESARNAAARIHEHHDNDDIGTDLQPELPVKMAARCDQHEPQRAQQHIAGAEILVERIVAGAEGEAVTE